MLERGAGSRRTLTMKLISRNAGAYTYQAPDGTIFGIAKSEDHDGPRGGLQQLWEVTTYQEGQGHAISSDFAPELRLKDCRDALRVYIAANHQTQTIKEATRPHPG
jgi:hypothetical protein